MSTVRDRVARDDFSDLIRFESFLAKIAPRLQRLPADGLPAAIAEAQRGLVETLDVDGAWIIQFSHDGGSFQVTHAFARDGAPSLEIGLDLTGVLPWYAAQVRMGQRLVYAHVPRGLPPEARFEAAYAARSGVKSQVILPLEVDGGVVGCLALATFRDYRDFSPEFLSRLDVLASIFASALQRSRFETRLKDARDLSRSIMVSMTNPAMVLDREGRVTAVNEAWVAPSERPRCAGIRVPMSEDAIPGRTGMAEGQGEFPDAVRSVLSGRSAHCEVTLRCKCQEGKCSYRVAISPLGAEEGGALVTRTDITELEESRAALEASLEEVRRLKDRLESENAILLQNIPRLNDFAEIVGRTPALSVVLEQVRRVAGTDAPVLVLGETGTGKGLVARAIHERSPRASRPLVTVNCAALPPTLIDSEMFGYEKGAFTGAIARTPGRFEVADRGTLLLDEIGELPLELQAKLLRVLQTGEFERLGSSRTLRVDVRLIAATNRDLEREVREGRFRADLFYRLSVFPLTLPPLRNRPEDIPLLVWHHIARRQAPLGRRIERVPERVMRALCAYSWPGNIRELENVIERALILSDGSTLATDPMFLGARLEVDASSAGSLSDVERQYIIDVLQQCGGKVAGSGNAADRLGLNRSTLLSRMKKLGISRRDYDDRRRHRVEPEPLPARARPQSITPQRA